MTAAHCLPHLPPAHAGSYTEERIYGKLLGQLGAEPDIATEVLFVDPVADVAILGRPDNQMMWEQAEAYDALIGSIAVLPLATLEFGRQTYTLSSGQTFLGNPEAKVDAWLLGLDGEWFSCRITCHRHIWIEEATKPLVSGMSGSPVLAQRGVIGVFNISAQHGDGDAHEGGPQPYLPNALPGWMLNK